jgi:hypothetical protein
MTIKLPKSLSPGRISETLYPLTLIVSGMLFYLVATGQTGWYFYVGLAFLLIERAIVAFVHWIAKVMAVQVMQRVLSAAAAQTSQPVDPTLGPIHGGMIEPPPPADDQE